MSEKLESVSGWKWLWGDSYADETTTPENLQDHKIAWRRAIPFILIHVACLAVLWVGISAAAVVIAVLSYLFRMFAVTAFYHRYFSHRAFRTSRVFQFCMGVAGCSAGQRGPLWWSGHHRWHHKHSDKDKDLHSPNLLGLLRSHVGWFLTNSAYKTPKNLVKDWYQYPELRWLNRLDWVPFVAYGFLMFGLGSLLNLFYPTLGTSGWQVLVWGFFISTIALYHATYTINSLAHRFGRRRFQTSDDSRNNLGLALITLGEGWHNNHHHYPASARQGFYWWEIDMTYYGLKLLSWCGLVWSLKPVSEKALLRNRVQPVDGEQ